MILISKFLILNINNIDTDLIIPKQFLKTLKKKGFYYCLFYDLRYIINQNNIFLNYDFPLNIKTNKNVKILISKKNFGCGSSREHAVWAIKDFGIKIIIAESFSDIFYDNSFKNNLFLIKLKKIEINSIINNYNVKKNIIFINIKYQFFKFNNKIYYFNINMLYKNILLSNFSIIEFLLEKKTEIFLFYKK
ncbi:3-isopropylmalate dehydratase small subunit [Candidatus Carsonella ruddii]|uniref:3-isopropylmalate dehydratase n=1 Tax=Candidatus Carsonella ruddii PC isolate NHV TaxID=1202540 RepID=J3YQQ4_CARRU|nr:3-isopropylmalate dehydratase small subunit [Candidatus Carsonella ruddii]AFP84308.1 3-isopropylmalate dehydratase small subunit [Candidatus Carsonella ruddii PC isolate NHV]